MSTTVTYKGETLTTVDNATVTLETAGKYCEDDFTLTDVSGGGGDYETANITLVNRTGMTFTYAMPSIVSGYLKVESGTMSNNASKSFVTPLYQGYTQVNNVSAMQGYTVSGDNVMQMGPFFYITGDGTATIENDL